MYLAQIHLVHVFHADAQRGHLVELQVTYTTVSLYISTLESANLASKSRPPLSLVSRRKELLGKRLGRKHLAEVACVAKPDTSWLGTESLSHRSSTARSVVRIQAGRH